MAPATPGLVLTTAATILLALASFNTPLLKSLYFLKATIGGNELKLGTLGYCSSTGGCSGVSVGYSLDLQTLLNVGNLPGNLNINGVSKWITYVLVLHPVALGCAAVASVFGVIAHFQEFGNSCLSVCFSSFAAGVALIAFIFDIILFYLARARVNDSGGSASMGNSIWIVLVAWVCLLLSGCAFGCGRRCINARGPRDADGRRGTSLKPDERYAEEARIEAIRMEEERKARAATASLSGFQPYEVQPLTGGQNGYHQSRNGQPVDQWLEEEDAHGDVTSGHPSSHVYRDYPSGNNGYPPAPASEASSYARGGYNAGIGAGGGGAMAGVTAPMPAAAAGAATMYGAGGYGGGGGGQQYGHAGTGGVLTRAPSDQFYAPGQATPGGYPAVEENAGYYQTDPYNDPYATDQYAPETSGYAPETSGYAAVVSTPYGAGPPQRSASSDPYAPNYQQQQHLQQQASSYAAAPYATRGLSSPTGQDPRRAMQHGFVSPGMAGAPIAASSSLAAARAASPATVYAPQPHHHPSRSHDGGSQPGGSSSLSAVDGPSGRGGGVEPPSYELSSLPGQAQQQGYPRDKASYMPSGGR